MFLTLLSMLGGGLMRLLPELLSFLNRKADNAHELAMLDRQFQLESTRAAARLDEVRVQGDISQTIALLDAQKTALSGQMQKTGMGFVDALNFLVRPLTTYYMLALYGVAKAALFWTAWQTGGDIWVAMLQIYDADDRAILGSLLSFWFVSRACDRNNGLIR